MSFRDLMDDMEEEQRQRLVDKILTQTEHLHREDYLDIEGSMRDLIEYYKQRPGADMELFASKLAQIREHAAHEPVPAGHPRIQINLPDDIAELSQTYAQKELARLYPDSAKLTQVIPEGRTVESPEKGKFT